MIEDNDGYLNFYNYIDSLCKELKARDLKSFTKNMFAHFDKDSDGYLNTDEFIQLDNLLVYPSNEGELKKDLIEKINKNGLSYDGLVWFSYLIPEIIGYSISYEVIKC